MAAAIQEDGQSEQSDPDDVGSVDRDDGHGTPRRMSRKEKRKLLKKERRRLARREAAKMEQEEIEARLNDPEERLKLEKMEQEEARRMEMDRMEFEERERRFLEALEEKKRMEEQEEKKREEELQRRQLEESQREQVENENPKEAGEGSDWEYVEEGPPEIIWQGNEIIVRKKKIKLPKKKSEQQKNKEEIGRPISNPLAPECEPFEDFKNAQELLESVAQKVPNFGTEQDKAHCPFHLKTGACRFGTHCSRVHFYPDKSCTLLMKNMYSGPGLSWEQDEGLEYTEEEIERSFEDFYEDVHTEFLKFGEIVNFKVCRNGSSHLRGNVYVHYKILESAVLAYHSINGRYFAGKQITCDFVNVTKWKVAICGEFMKSGLKTCSRGSICNFIHCFQNPGGDYEWADMDKEPPRHWVRKMAALFGYKDGYHKYLDSGGPSQNRGDKMLSRDAESYRSKRSRSKDLESRHIRSRCGDDWNTRRQRFRHGSYRKENSFVRNTDEESIQSKDKCHRRRRDHKTYSNDDESGGILKDGHYTHKRRCHRSRRRRGSIGVGSDSDEDSFHYESKTVNSRRNKTLYRDKTHNQDDDFDSEASSLESYRDESGKGEERHTRSKRRGQRGIDSEPEDSNSDSTDEKDPKYTRRLSKQPRQGLLQFSNCEYRGGRSDKDGEEEYSRHSSGSSRRKRKKSGLTLIDSPSRGEDSYRYETRKRGRDADRENKRSRANGEKRSSGHPRNYSLSDASTQANDHKEKIREDSYRDLVEGNCNEVSMRCLKEAELNGSYERREKGENEEGYEVQQLKAGSECLSFKQRSMDSGTEEMAYRRAALEKLEEKKRSKEKLLHQNSDNIASLESGDNSAPRSMPKKANVVSENQKDEKVNINHGKRLRI